jgi:hypothetical protein
MNASDDTVLMSSAIRLALAVAEGTVVVLTEGVHAASATNAMKLARLVMGR